VLWAPLRRPQNQAPGFAGAGQICSIGNSLIGYVSGQPAVIHPSEQIRESKFTLFAGGI